MGKVSTAARLKYQEKTKEYKALISKMDTEAVKSAAKLVKGDTNQNLLRIELADQNLNLVSYLALMNALSLSLLAVKNEAYLNEARKALYKAIINLEEIVSANVDVPFSEYEEGVLSIDSMGDETKCRLIRKLGYSIQTVQDGFGSNSKWKWSFVELEARYATVCKNMINFKTYVAKLDPRIDGYNERVGHVKIVKELLQTAADGYRQKYELSTRRIDDMQMAINYLLALRRVYIFIGEADNADVTKKKVDIWKQKMDADQKAGQKQ